MSQILLLTLSFGFLYGNSYDFYIKKSNDLKLYDDKYWHTLLHMNGDKSEIDSSSFFLAKDGKTNPHSEINATITGIFKNNQTICKYPARYHWLKDKLDIKELKGAKCEELDKFIKTVNPKSATLVFPSAHISSPASMFGHTFLRIDSSYESKMLSSAINYAASANQDTENGFLFAIKGLFGGYAGQYSLLPYYDKLKEYGDKDQRDIWEYKLNLNAKEIMTMTRHIWELKDSRSDYFFFDENCAYNMLWLAEVARDGVSLRGDFLYHVSPPETIFAMQKSGLISATNYRPSKRTKMLAYEKLLGSEEKRAVKSLLSKTPLNLDDTNMTAQQKRYVLEFATELNEDNYINRKTSKDEYLDTSHALLTKRATLGEGSELKIAQPANPLEAHRGLKVSLGDKFVDDKHKIILGVRPVYHGLDDSDSGIIDGSEIRFLDTQVGISDGGDVSVESLDILSISSLVNVTTFSKPFSWSARFAFDRNSPSNELDFDSGLGIGVRKNILNDTSYLYYLFGFGANEYSDWSGYGFHRLGLVWSQNGAGKLNIDIKQRKFTNGFVQLNAEVSENLYLSQSTALKFGFERIQREANQKSENIHRVTLNYFF